MYGKIDVQLILANCVKLDIGRSVYHFLQYIYIYIHSNEIHNVAPLVGMYICCVKLVNDVQLPLTAP